MKYLQDKSGQKEIHNISLAGRLFVCLVTQPAIDIITTRLYTPDCIGRI